jgi:hypothetical protein
VRSPYFFEKKRHPSLKECLIVKSANGGSRKERVPPFKCKNMQRKIKKKSDKPKESRKEWEDRIEKTMKDTIKKVEELVVHFEELIEKKRKENLEFEKDNKTDKFIEKWKKRKIQSDNNIKKS